MIYPKHVALIPDGNRTWAQEKQLPKMIGHMEGLKRVIELSKYIFSSTPVKVFSAWGLSTENLNSRTPEELEYLFDLYKQLPVEMYNFLKEQKVNFKWVGSEKGLPESLIKYLRNNEKEFSFDTDRYNIMCINYGGRDEIIRGVNKCLQHNIKEIDEEILTNHLDFAGLPNVDLMIRTKGDMSRRLSGFMLWNIGYAELYFSELKCPDFDTKEMIKALEWYDSISDKRNFGK